MWWRLIFGRERGVRGFGACGSSALLALAVAILVLPGGPALALERDAVTARISSRDLSSPRSAEAAALDEDIARAVEHELRREDALPTRLVGLRVERGVVLLTGRLPTLLARTRVLARVDLVTGVRGVVDLLVVDPPHRADREIAKDVARAVAPGIGERRAGAIAVAVRGGLVILSGPVASFGEREVALLTTEGVPGVRAIDDRLAVRPGAPRDDASIRREVRGRLDHDVRVEDRNIEVIVTDGVVRLRGTVSSEVEWLRARSDAVSDGVHHVDASALVVSAPVHPTRTPSSLALRTDGDIAAGALAAFALDPRLAWSSPRVSVTSGLVTLTGPVDSLSARRAAVADARNTRGVLGVRDELEVVRVGRLDDATVRARLRSAFRADPVLSTAAVHVAVLEGRALLTGCLETRAELARADDVAALVAGLTSIASDLALGCGPGGPKAAYLERE